MSLYCHSTASHVFGEILLHWHRVDLSNGGIHSAGKSKDICTFAPSSLRDPYGSQTAPASALRPADGNSALTPDILDGAFARLALRHPADATRPSPPMASALTAGSRAQLLRPVPSYMGLFRRTASPWGYPVPRPRSATERSERSERSEMRGEFSSNIEVNSPKYGPEARGPLGGRAGGDGRGGCPPAVGRLAGVGANTDG